ncbi:hypothetical protein D3C86_1014220 [compost metagenome]
MVAWVVGVASHVSDQVRTHSPAVNFHHETQALLTEAVCNLNLVSDVCGWFQDLPTDPRENTRVDYFTTTGKFLHHRQLLRVNVVAQVERAQELVVVRTGWAEQQLFNREVGHL